MPKKINGDKCKKVIDDMYSNVNVNSRFFYGIMVALAILLSILNIILPFTKWFDANPIQNGIGWGLALFYCILYIYYK